MKHAKARYGITFLVLVWGCLFVTGQHAQADIRWEKKIVSVPYTYYEYETQTRYQLVQKAVTVMDYRYERRAVTTYRYERRRVAVEIPSRRRGVTRVRYVWKNVRVPETTYETIRVPCEKTVYKTVRRPYRLRVRVERTGYRSEAQWVKVRVRDRDKKFTLNLSFNGYGSSYSSSYRNSYRRKSDSVRDRVYRKSDHDFYRSNRTAVPETTAERTRTKRISDSRRRR